METTPHRLRELAAVFLRLGATAFGGPAAHIAVMRDEFVDRRGWVTDDEYAELIGLANLVPGPNSTEVAMHIGRVRAGRRGLVVAGVAFILPAFVLMTALAWLYTEFGALPRFRGALAAVAAVVVVLVLDAAITLARSTIRDATAVTIFAVATAAALLGLHDLAILVAAGAVAWIARRATRGRSGAATTVALTLGGVVEAVGPVAATVGPVALIPILLVFAQIGAILYGSGYVLYALLEQILVHQHHWITQRQLLDAIAAGQLTPGPLFTTATFIGFTLRGIPGAVVATVGIFLPAFGFVAVTDVVVRRLRGNAGFAAVVGGVVAASLGLMVAVLVALGRQAITGVGPAVIAGVALVLLWRRRPNPLWLILAAGAAGIAWPHLG